MALADNMPKDAIGDMKRQIRDLQRDIREMRAERRLEAATIGAGGLTVKGGMIQLVDPITGDVLALLDATGLTVDGNASFGGNTTIGGNAAIVGTLSLPAGIIGNDALTEPIAVARLHDDAQGFSVPTGAGAQILSASVAIPSGYSQALVLTQVVSLTALNDTAASDFLYADVKVSGASSVGWQIGSSNVPAGATGVATQMSSDHRTGLSGGTLTIIGYVSSAFGTWGADSSNVANLDASVVFLR